MSFAALKNRANTKLNGVVHEFSTRPAHAIIKYTFIGGITVAGAVDFVRHFGPSIRAFADCTVGALDDYFAIKIFDIADCAERFTVPTTRSGAVMQKAKAAYAALDKRVSYLDGTIIHAASNYVANRRTSSVRNTFAAVGARILSFGLTLGLSTGPVAADAVALPQQVRTYAMAQPPITPASGLKRLPGHRGYPTHTFPLLQSPR